MKPKKQKPRLSYLEIQCIPMFESLFAKRNIEGQYGDIEKNTEAHSVYTAFKTLKEFLKRNVE